MLQTYKDWLKLLLPPLLVSSSPAWALPENDIMDLPLEQLMDISITSASKREQQLNEVAAAVTVLTHEKIRQSGVTTLPDALKLVPGVQVSQVFSDVWSISIRSFQGEFANKLLVLIDGRSIYTPLFSGVYWQFNDVLLEDVDRIEVIRGPGATLWGANAVNGIINIITKQAKDTQGTLLSLGGGVGFKRHAAVRHGGQLSDHSFWSVYAKNQAFDELEIPNTDTGAQDTWSRSQAGFRYDQEQEEFSFMVSGDIYETSGDFIYATNQLQENSARGNNVLTRYRKKWSPIQSTSIQFYYDKSSVHQGNAYDVDAETYDLELQQNLFWRNHNIVTGVGYRSWLLRNSPFLLVSFPEKSYKTDLWDVFIQDEISFMDDRLKWTLGTKVEKNTMTGVEIQPNIRALYHISPNYIVWAAVSNAVRTPSLYEDSLNTLIELPIGLISLQGNNELEAEELVASELGIRLSPNNSLYVDWAFYYHEYEKLVDIISDITITPDNKVVSTSRQENGPNAEVYGFEISFDYTPMDQWALKYSYSFSKTDIDNGFFTRNLAPKHAVIFNSFYSFTNKLDWDLTLNYQGKTEATIPVFSSTGYINTTVKERTTLDTRLGYHLTDALTFSLIGKNIFNEQTIEGYATLPTRSTPTLEPSRAWLLHLLWEL